MPRDDRSAEDQLRHLQTLTDSALARLDVEDFVVELLERARGILNADTAAYLALDVDANQLIARAASGIEEEVRQGVRVPLGIGFAGRIAETKRPLMLDRVDSTTVANPILWEKGIRVMLGVPLFAGPEVMGVLHVGRLDERPFGPDDVELLQVVAERIAHATQARQLSVERAAANVLERSLLPSRLPACPGLSFATRYLTPEHRMVGGDWYDLFVLPSGELWVVTGDVIGHGLPAAVVMGRVRSTLRAYALVGGTPAAVLDQTDRKVQHFEIDTMVTVTCARATFPYDQLEIASAGHPAPVVAHPSSQAFFASIAVSPPLGVVDTIIRSTTTISLPPGGVVLLYTDGLVEQRGQDLGDGLHRLLESVRCEPAEDVCRTAIRAMLGTRPPQDDVAMVAIHRQLGPLDEVPVNAAHPPAESARLRPRRQERYGPGSGPGW